MTRERFLHGVAFGAAVIGVAAVAWLLARLVGLVVLVVMSVILTAGLAPIVERIEGVRVGALRVPRVFAIALVFTVVLIVFIGIGGSVWDVVTDEARDFAVSWPSYEARVRDWLEGLVRRYPLLPTQPQLIEYARESFSHLVQFSRGGVAAVFGVLGGLASGVLVVMLTFYMLTSREALGRAFLAMVPTPHREAARRVVQGMSAKLGAWVRAQVFLSLLMGGAAGIGLSVIGVRYAFLLAVLTGLGEFIPMLGPIIAGTLAVLVAVLSGGVTQALIVLVFFLTLQALENYLLVPKLMQQQVGLHPLATILALLAGGTLLGIVGAILAVPVVAALSVPLQEVVRPAAARATPAARPE